MFYIALLFLILLGGTALIIVAQNFTTLLSSEHLMLLTVSLPATPILLLCLFWAFLGGLLLYVFSAFAARRDTRELKTLHARIKELEKAQTKSTSGALATNVAPPAVPAPGFSSTGPLRPWQQPTNPPPNFPPSGPLQQGQPPNNLSPALSQLNMPVPTRPLPPLPQQGVPPPPFQRQ